MERIEISEDTYYALMSDKNMKAKGKRMLDRLIDRIEDMELDCDAEVYDALLKIQYAMA